MSKSPIHNTPARILGLSTDELEKIKEQFPYFNPARMLLLKQHQSTGDSNDVELSSAAVWSHDRKKLYDFLKKKNHIEPPVIQEEIPPVVQEEVPAAEPEEVPAIVHQDQPLEGQIPVAEEQVILVEQPEIYIAPIIEADLIERAEEKIAEPVDELTTDPDMPEIIEEPENPVVSSPAVAEAIKLEPEQEYTEEEETNNMPLPEARKFIIADHTFDEWLDHFKRGKHSVKKSLEEMPKAKEEAADELDRLIESSLPATFFHDKLESETQYAKGLESFIESQKKKKAGVTKPAETGLVTETLAKIYERQGLVDKAIGVYEQLILKNPEKSAYFAVQIQRLKNK